MADDQDTQGGGDDIDDYDKGDGADSFDSGVSSTPVPDINVDGTTTVGDDYDDGPIPDFTVKLIINDGPDLADAAITDNLGDMIPRTTPFGGTVYDATHAIGQEIQNQLNGTDASGKKGFFGSWTSKKVLYVGLIALCIIAIILAILFFVIGKRRKANKKPTPAGSTTVTRGVVAKNVSPNPKYEKVAQKMDA